MINKDNVRQSEYIIVINEKANIADALIIFRKYDARLVRDLKKKRFLIELKRDPGLERLKSLVESSELIEFIQPNYIYQQQ